MYQMVHTHIQFFKKEYKFLICIHSRFNKILSFNIYQKKILIAIRNLNI